VSEPALELREVSRVFARRHALRRGREEVRAVSGVSLTVSAGEIVALVGESGAGKSTIGRMVLGLEEPDGGQVLFQGVDVGRLRGRARRSVRRRMHLILQDPYESLHPGMRVREAVAEPLAIAGVRSEERRPRVVAALEEVALTPPPQFLERYPHELSGGQRQRVAMARAFICRPTLIVADEPTSMLDATLRAEILELVAHMRDRHRAAFLFITHDLAVARHISDRIAVMRAGRIVEIDDSERLVATPRADYTKTLLAASEGEIPPEEAP